MYCVRARGISALREPANLQRLRTFDAAAKRQLNERIAKLDAGTADPRKDLAHAQS